MTNPVVAIMMGSSSDAVVMAKAAEVLRDFGVAAETKVLSAHRTPKETACYAEELAGRGFKVVICGAGMSAALAGVVAAHTSLPVIGVPLEASLGGIDALLSTVQMPPGVPVAAVAVGPAGAKNAAYLALRILALENKGLVKRLEEFRETQRKKILEAE
ncbi:MAG: 5-(carboxyamino)imidazole ribonucleotide mutase [Candidatus Omnitrophica bacterium]|nr:5-(carboxyamino)imidazole ribonucleotide mutase [Candidatus Omnitrophota bacterium]